MTDTALNTLKARTAEYLNAHEHGEEISDTEQAAMKAYFHADDICVDRANDAVYASYGRCGGRRGFREVDFAGFVWEVRAAMAH